ncbi:hypothetical protein KJ885_01750, partial [Patescibacteria group bacterium]|nr:hypothetical protein [Patescibacteria group bacterium]
SRFYYNFFLLCVVILGWFYFLFASNTFKITDWEINGLQQYNQQEAEAVLKKFFNNRKLLVFGFSNIFVFNEKDLKKYLSPSFTFKNVHVDKYYPHKVTITLEEKKEKLAIYNKNKIYILADDGTVIMEKQGIGGWYSDAAEDTNTTSTKDANIDMKKLLADAESRVLPDYPIFCDAYYLDKDLGVGDAYPAMDIIKITTTFIDNLHERSDIDVKSVALYENQVNPKIVVYTTTNWKIYLNNTTDGLKQFYKLFLAYNNEIKDPNKQLEYIDLRFGDRVYIK